MTEPRAETGDAGRPPPRWSGGIGFVLVTIGRELGLSGLPPAVFAAPLRCAVQGLIAAMVAARWTS